MEIFSKKLLARMLPIEWIQPTLTSNGTFGGDTMAVDWTWGANNGVSGVAYTAFQPNTGELYVYADEYKTWLRIYMYIPRPVRLTGISFYIRTVFASSGAAYNVHLYGGNSKGDMQEELKDIGTVGKDYQHTEAVTTEHEYQYYTLYLENGGWAYNDSVCIRQIKLTAEYDGFE